MGSILWNPGGLYVPRKELSTFNISISDPLRISVLFNLRNLNCFYYL